MGSVRSAVLAGSGYSPEAIWDQGTPNFGDIRAVHINHHPGLPLWKILRLMPVLASEPKRYSTKELSRIWISLSSSGRLNGMKSKNSNASAVFV